MTRLLTAVGVLVASAALAAPETLDPVFCGEVIVEAVEDHRATYPNRNRVAPIPLPPGCKIAHFDPPYDAITTRFGASLVKDGQIVALFPRRAKSPPPAPMKPKRTLPALSVISRDGSLIALTEDGQPPGWLHVEKEGNQ